MDKNFLLLNHAKKYVASIRKSICIFFSVSLCSVALAQPAKRFEVISITDTTVVGARALSDSIEGRWGVVELMISMRKPGSAPKEIRRSMKSIASVDCNNRGFKRITQMFNLEVDPEKEDRWASAEMDPEYANGFAPQKIVHQPVSDELKKEKAKFAAETTDPTRSLIMNIGRNWPEAEELSVDYFCAVAVDRLSENQAAAKIRNTAGLNDLTSLICTLGSPRLQNTTDVELMVRFHEQLGYVQVQGVWRITRSIGENLIAADMQPNKLTISRLTGKASIVIDGETAMQGDCIMANSSVKKF